MRLPDEARHVIERVSPSVVFHLAAPVNPDLGGHAQQVFRDGIIAGTAAVVDGCSAIGARLVHVGSCAEYGSVPAPYSEEQRCAPHGEYGRLKHEASEVVRGNDTVEWSIVRPFRSLGPGDDASVVAAAARAALQSEVFEMTDGAQVREWNHVDAVARGIVAAGSHPGAVRQLINVGGGPRVSVRQVVERIFVLANADPSLVRIGARPRRPHEVNQLFGDHARAEGLWGVVQQPTLDETLEAVLSWQRSQIGGAA